MITAIDADNQIRLVNAILRLDEKIDRVEARLDRRMDRFDRRIWELAGNTESPLGGFERPGRRTERIEDVAADIIKSLELLFANGWGLDQTSSPAPQLGDLAE